MKVEAADRKANELRGVGQMMDDQIWNVWRQDWQWMVRAIKQKGYAASLILAPPAAADDLESLEQDHGLVLPTEFTEVLTRFSGRVQLDWQIGNPLSIRPPADVPEPYNWQIRRGAGDLWDVEMLLFLWQRYDAWLGRFEEIEAQEQKSGLIDPEHCRERIWHNKSPFLAVGNGDLLAFDLAHGNRKCPVVYLDHEWGRRNGCRLGLDFIDFVSRWSNLGCPDPLSLHEFHDPDLNLLMDSNEFVANWKRWLNIDPRQGVLALE